MKITKLFPYFCLLIVVSTQSSVSQTATHLHSANDASHEEHENHEMHAGHEGHDVMHEDHETDGNHVHHPEHASHMTRSKEAVPFRNLMKKAITVVPVLEDGTEHGKFHIRPDQSVLIPVRPETVITHFIIDDETFDECYLDGMKRKEPVASVELKSLMFGEHDEYPPHLMCGD